MNWKKFGYALHQKRVERDYGYRKLAAELRDEVTPATISFLENVGDRKVSEERLTKVPLLLNWMGMTEAEIEAIELPPELPQQSEEERTAPICFDCKTPLVNVGPKRWKETQAVNRMKYYEDDAEMITVDETFTVEGMGGYCPKCKKQRTQDWFSGLWW